MLAKDVRVASDELLVEAADDVVDREGAVVRGDLRVQDHLLQDVAELLDQMLVVIRLDGLHGLVGLLDHVLGDRAVRLLAVPRATIRLAQAPHRAHEAVELGVRGRRVRARDVLRVHAVGDLGHSGSFCSGLFSPAILARDG